MTKEKLLGPIKKIAAGFVLAGWVFAATSADVTELSEDVECSGDSEDIAMMSTMGSGMGSGGMGGMGMSGMGGGGMGGMNTDDADEPVLLAQAPCGGMGSMSGMGGMGSMSGMGGMGSMSGAMGTMSGTGGGMGGSMPGGMMGN